MTTFPYHHLTPPRQASLHFAESNQACVDSVPWQRLSKRATVHTGDQVIDDGGGRGRHPYHPLMHSPSLPSQANRKDLRRWKREVGGKRPFDVVGAWPLVQSRTPSLGPHPPSSPLPSVDDGGRPNSVTWTSFHTLFHEALSDGGLYFIEDL